MLCRRIARQGLLVHSFSTAFNFQDCIFPGSESQLVLIDHSCGREAWTRSCLTSSNGAQQLRPVRSFANRLERWNRAHETHILGRVEHWLVCPELFSYPHLSAHAPPAGVAFRSSSRRVTRRARLLRRRPCLVARDAWRHRTTKARWSCGGGALVPGVPAAVSRARFDGLTCWCWGDDGVVLLQSSSLPTPNTN